MEFNQTQKTLMYAFEKGYRIIDGKCFLGSRQIIGNISKHGYRVFGLTIKKRALPVPFHRLVAFEKYGTAIFGKNIHVRHLDSNPLNNMAANIAIGTAQENTLDRAPELRRESAMHAANSIRKYDLSEVLRLKSEGYNDNQIAVKVGAAPSTITALSNRYFTAPEGYVKKPITRKRMPVIQLNMQGDVIAYFDSCRAAAREIGGRGSCILLVCKGRLKQAHGFRWRFNDS